MHEEKEKHLSVFLKDATYTWLDCRAKRNSRAKCREAATIIEAERLREARVNSQGVLDAQGGRP